MSLKEQRLARGLTIKELAERSGVHPVKIYQIEVGKINPENMTLKNAEKLAKALGCSTSEFLN